MQSLLLKSDQFKSGFVGKLEGGDITDVVMEIPSLSPKYNNGNTGDLLLLGGMIMRTIHDTLGLFPVVMTSQEARMWVFPELLAVRKYRKDRECTREEIRQMLYNHKIELYGDYPHDCRKKDIVWNKVMEMCPDVKWLYDKKGNLKKENYSACDSLVCALAYVYKNLRTDGNPRVSQWREDTIIENGVEKPQFTYIIEFGDVLYEKTVTLSGDEKNKEE
ncbi:MAG: hypothetical protein LUD72_05355 [Bacteroidales bacterium]|nr:hypothetical protein [Bacteroidales bacterium]